VSPATDLARAVAAARAASARVAQRPRRDVARALAAAGRRWREDPELREALPPEARLSPPVVAAGLDIVARMLDPQAMVELVERELGSERPTGPWLVAHVTASNVPALGVPAIALTCLAGAAAVVKSGRADRLSAPAFRRALEAEDAELAETVVTTYWAGGDAAAEHSVLAAADVVVATGRDETADSIVRRHSGAVIAHGERTSLAVIGRTAIDDAAIAERVARDVALHDQRGCLSPVAVLVDGDARAFAERLVAALAVLADAWPPGPLTTAERAAHRSLVAEAEWIGAAVLDSAGGTVLVHDDPRPRGCPGRRTVWVHPLTSLSQAVLPGRVECVGLARARVDIDALRRLGVSRVCDAGTMQRPPLSWPRGQHAPLRTLLRLSGEPRLEVDVA
jgi:acyl-CoA reductase-like NAD-dependent aldehyde dehydrogenase